MSSVIGKKGAEQHQPRTEEEWAEVRHRAIPLMEASNLLLMDGRQKAIDAKDSMALEEAGGTLDAACEACHTKYWYPNQDGPEQTK